MYTFTFLQVESAFSNNESFELNSSFCLITRIILRSTSFILKISVSSSKLLLFTFDGPENIKRMLHPKMKIQSLNTHCELIGVTMSYCVSIAVCAHMNPAVISGVTGYSEQWGWKQWHFSKQLDMLRLRTLMEAIYDFYYGFVFVH